MDDVDIGKLGIDPDLIEQVLKEQTKRKRQPRRPARYIGAPLSFLSDVCRLTEGRTTLLVALCIYRRTCVCDSRTVTLPNAELAELGIDWRRKREALARLQSAGLIEVKSTRGRTARITLKWR
jgi:hypothetical protein